MELYKDENFVQLLDSIRLHAGTTRTAQKDYFRSRSNQNLQIAKNCERHLDSLLQQAGKIIRESGQLKIF
jgi:hypothetical protein